MANALNALRVRRKLTALPLHILRPQVSSGARGMLYAGFNLNPEHAGYISLRDEFYEEYERALCVDSHWFAGVEEVVNTLERRGLRWGIVTNKSIRFTTPLVHALGIAPRAACVVSGDTTPHAKPHPGPLLHAAGLLGVAPQQCLYVGDDKRDIDAANAAGMIGVAACYGYLGAEGNVATWNAAHQIDSPLDLLALLA